MKKRTQTEFQLPSARLLRQAPSGPYGKTYSRQSEHDRSKYARGGLDDRGELRLQRVEAGWIDLGFHRTLVISRSARRQERSAFRLGEVWLDRVAGEYTVAAVYEKRHTL